MDDILTAISIFIALMTWLVSHRRDAYHKRAAYTAEVLSALSTSDRLAESSYQVTKLINGGVKPSLTDISPDVERHVVDILDYYEFLCDLYTKRIVDRKTIVQLRGRLMRRTWQVCERYVRETSETQHRRVYDGFERFVNMLPPDDSPVFITRAPLTVWQRVQRLFRSRSHALPARVD